MLVRDSFNRFSLKTEQNNSLKEIFFFISKTFSDYSISFYLYQDFLDTFHSFTDDSIFLSDFEFAWLLNKSGEFIPSDSNLYSLFYMPSRNKSVFKDIYSIDKHRKIFLFDCDDFFCIFLYSSDHIFKGFFLLHRWHLKSKVNKKDLSLSKQICFDFNQKLNNLEVFSIHDHIKQLLNDEKVGKEQQILQERLSSFSLLNESSIRLANSYSVKDILEIFFSSLSKLMRFDVSSVFLFGFSFDETFFVSSSFVLKPISISFIKASMESVLSSFVDDHFFEFPLSPSFLTTSNCIDEDNYEAVTYFNVPLLFNNEFLGVLHVSSQQPNAFSISEMSFFNKITSQLAVNLQRLRVINRFDISRVSALIQSMKDPVIVVDSSHHFELYNSAANDAFDLVRYNSQVNGLPVLLKNLSIYSLYEQFLSLQKPVINHRLEYKNSFYSVNINSVIDHDLKVRGTILVFRNITDLVIVDKIQNQRLEVIAKVNLILKSFMDLDNLLSVLMELILKVAHAEMGSILLKDSGSFVCKCHSNFPEKIRKLYSFKSGDLIADKVISSGEFCLIENYFENELVHQQRKVLLDWYIAIPLFVQNELIGVINIAKKYNDRFSSIHNEEIKTLNLLTNLSGTAIHNAMNYENFFVRQKLDHELRVANDIQSRLLPTHCPKLQNFFIDVLSKPAREIGGDYYDFFNLKNGNLGIVIADIVGKGIPAGLFMAMLKSILAAQLPFFDCPKKALEKVNSILLSERIIDKFVPMFYGILDINSTTFSYSNAGHEPVLHFSKGECHILDTQGLPIAAQDDCDYEVKKIMLHPSDLLLFYTDGVIELRNSKKNTFGIQSLQKYFSEFSENPPDIFINKMQAILMDFSNGQHLHDDLTMIVLKALNQNKNAQDQTKINFEECFTVKSSKQNVAYIRSKLQIFLNKLDFSDSEIFDFKLAINEVHCNVIEHAYSDEDHHDIIFKFYAFDKCVKISIRDFGQSFDSTCLEQKNINLVDLEGSGLGLFLMKRFVDKYEYIPHTQGTELIITKYFS